VAWDLAPKSHTNFLLKIYNLLVKITNAGNAQVSLLSNFGERNLDSKKFKFKRYNDFLNSLDILGRVREMITQRRSTPQGKTRTTKRLRDLVQHNPEQR